MVFSIDDFEYLPFWLAACNASSFGKQWLGVTSGGPMGHSKPLDLEVHPSNAIHGKMK